jgi:DNA polymerase elongation subunit (family B)
MNMELSSEKLLDDPLVGGCDPVQGLVAVEHVGGRAADSVLCWFRRGSETVCEPAAFRPFIAAAETLAARCPVSPCETVTLAGGAPINRLLFYGTWSACQKARQWMAKESGSAASDSGASFAFISDPVQQYLTVSGRTLFRGMRFDDVRRLQVDIECMVSGGHEFCNAEREGDRIVAIGLGDDSGWSMQLGGACVPEADLIRRFVEVVRERDPDVIEGHNIFQFDLPYLAERARRHKVKLAIGRDGSAPERRPSRFSVAERTIAYDRFDIFGRHVVDTYFLVQIYDVSHRSLDGFGLKAVAIHFGIAAPDRTYLDAALIGEIVKTDPDRVMRYVADDVAETGRLARLLSGSSFIQARILPLGYQNVCLRGNGTKIDALLVREYLRHRHSLPKPDEAKPFAGGATEVFVKGVVRGVHHCDVRSLYPSLMLVRRLGPRQDERGVFLALLAVLRRVRLEAKAAARGAGPADAFFLDAMQSALKVLINSFYGYLGFSQGRFSDFTAASEVAAGGRELLDRMLRKLREQGAQPVEMDTDGIYFVPPAGAGPGEQERFRAGVASVLPEGIEVEFDEQYAAMYSYMTKNYALLSCDGEMVVKGAALKSRGIEPFLRGFLREFVRLMLTGKEAEVTALKGRYEADIGERRLDIRKLAKTETLQDAPSNYAAKIGRGGRGRNAAYELALRSGREYKAGDQISYYVTGTKATVKVFEAARPVSEWNPAARDENVPYYLAKLNALYEKFTGGDTAAAEGTVEEAK